MNPPAAEHRRFFLRHRRVGLSLVEVLITVAIIGVLAGIVLPQLQAGVPDRLVAAAEIVAADLEYARSLAVANGSKYQVSFEPDENHYWLEHTGTIAALEVLPYSPFRAADDPPQKQTTELSSLPFGSPEVQLVGAVRAASGGAEVQDVEFTPLGGTTRADETVVWLGCGHGDGRRYLPLTIHPTTGMVEIGTLTTQLTDALDDVRATP